MALDMALRLALCTVGSVIVLLTVQMPLLITVANAFVMTFTPALMPVKHRPIVTTFYTVRNRAFTITSFKGLGADQLHSPLNDAGTDSLDSLRHGDIYGV
jgi:hypothetical protein